MTFLDGTLIIVAATSVVAALAFGVDRHLRVRRVSLTVPEEPTPVERPCLNPANQPFVAAMLLGATEIELSAGRVAGGLRDLANVVRATAKDPVGLTLRSRVAALIYEHSGAHRRAGQRVEEAGT